MGLNAAEVVSRLKDRELRLVFQSLLSAGITPEMLYEPYVQPTEVMDVKITNGSDERTFDKTSFTFGRMVNLFRTVVSDMKRLGYLTGYAVSASTTYTLNLTTLTDNALAEFLCAVINDVQTNGHLTAHQYSITGKLTKFTLNCDAYTLNGLGRAVAGFVTWLGVSKDADGDIYQLLSEKNQTNGYPGIDGALPSAGYVPKWTASGLAASNLHDNGSRIKSSLADLYLGGDDLSVKRSAAGKLLLYDPSGGVTQPVLQFGGSTSSYPGIRNNSAIVEHVLADVSDYAEVREKGLSTIGGDISMFTGGFATRTLWANTGNGVRLVSGLQFQFSSSATAATTAADTGLSRAAAGVTRSTDGSTGFGQHEMSKARLYGAATGFYQTLDSGTPTANKTTTFNNRDGTAHDGGGKNAWAAGLGAITHIEGPSDQNLKVIAPASRDVVISSNNESGAARLTISNYYGEGPWLKGGTYSGNQTSMVLRNNGEVLFPAASGSYALTTLGGVTVRNATTTKCEIGSASTRTTLSLRSGSQLTWSTDTYLVDCLARLYMPSTSPGNLLIDSYDPTTYPSQRLMFGGTTSSYPALKRNGAVFESKLADDTAYTEHAVSKARLYGAATGFYTTLDPGTPTANKTLTLPNSIDAKVLAHQSPTDNVLVRANGTTGEVQDSAVSDSDTVVTLGRATIQAGDGASATIKTTDGNTAYSLTLRGSDAASGNSNGGAVYMRPGLKQGSGTSGDAEVRDASGNASIRVAGDTGTALTLKGYAPNAAYTEVSSNVTLTESSATYQHMKLDAARDVTLPATPTTNLLFMIFNYATSGGAATVKDSAGNTVASLAVGEWCFAQHLGSNAWSAWGLF